MGESNVLYAIPEKLKYVQSVSWHTESHNKTNTSSNATKFVDETDHNP